VRRAVRDRRRAAHEIVERCRALALHAPQDNELNIISGGRLILATLVFWWLAGAATILDTIYAIMNLLDRL